MLELGDSFEWERPTACGTQKPKPIYPIAHEIDDYITELEDEKKNDTSPRKAGQQAQDEFTKRMQSLVQGLKTMQLEVEPNVVPLIIS